MEHITSDVEIAQENLEASKLPVQVGAAAGVAGALAVMMLVGLLLVLSGQDIFTAARSIASVVMGESASSGFLPVIIGTVIHLAIGTALGAVFALLMPRTYRSIWLVAGPLYGVVAWFVAYFLVLRPLFPFVANTNSAYALLLAHVVYGVILGMVGARYGLSSWDWRWRFKSKRDR